MPKQYLNTHVTETLAALLKDKRLSLGLEIQDVAEMTGFDGSVITLIEKQGNPTVSQLTEIAFAYKMHPKIFMSMNLEIQSRYNLSPQRLQKSRLTVRIKKLVANKFFASFKSSKEVLDKLLVLYPDNKDIATKSISVILSRLVTNGILEVKKAQLRNSNLYRAVKSPAKK